MTVREDPEQDELQRLTLSDYGPFDLGEDALGVRVSSEIVIDT